MGIVLYGAPKFTKGDLYLNIYAQDKQQNLLSGFQEPRSFRFFLVLLSLKKKVLRRRHGKTKLSIFKSFKNVLKTRPKALI